MWWLVLITISALVIFFLIVWEGYVLRRLYASLVGISLPETAIQKAWRFVATYWRRVSIMGVLSVLGVVLTFVAWRYPDFWKQGISSTNSEPTAVSAAYDAKDFIEFRKHDISQYKTGMYQIVWMNRPVHWKLYVAIVETSTSGKTREVALCPEKLTLADGARLQESGLFLVEYSDVSESIRTAFELLRLGDHIAVEATIKDADKKHPNLVLYSAT